jgi:hypothetical protein
MTVVPRKILTSSGCRPRATALRRISRTVSAKRGLGMTVDEHRLGMAARERSARRRRASLEQEGRAPRRGMHKVDGVEIVMGTVVRHPPDTVRSSIDAGLPVAYDGVVGPASLPQIIDHIEEFLGALVACVVGTEAPLAPLSRMPVTMFQAIRRASGDRVSRNGARADRDVHRSARR